MSDLNRRDFVVGTVVAAACATCGLSDAAAQQRPRGGGGGDGKKAPPNGGAVGGNVDVGAISDYPADGISDKFVKANKLFIIRSDNKIFATTAVCTHRYCVLGKADKQLACACHGSKFSINGTPGEGPAKVALTRYAIRKNDKGKLIVDTSKPFREKDWKDPASFIDASA